MSPSDARHPGSRRDPTSSHRPGDERRLRDTHAFDVAASLRELLAEHASERHGHAVCRALNLLVAPGPRDAVRKGLDALEAHHPARTIILRAHEEKQLDADLRIVNPDGAWTEEVVLRADPDRLAHADSLVAPLLVTGLEEVTWLPGDEPGPGAERLAAISDHVVLDSTGGDARAALRFARWASEQADVHDVAWGEVAGWRAQVVAAFDDPDHLAILADAEELRIGSTGVYGLLLLGWIVARAGWTLKDETTARRKDGATVAIALGADLSGLLLRAGERELRVQRGAKPVSAFVSAVAVVPDYARGYRPALDALEPVLS